MCSLSDRFQLNETTVTQRGKAEIYHVQHNLSILQFLLNSENTDIQTVEDIRETSRISTDLHSQKLFGCKRDIPCCSVTPRNVL
jgi:hypothetical protein